MRRLAIVAAVLLCARCAPPARALIVTVRKPSSESWSDVPVAVPWSDRFDALGTGPLTVDGDPMSAAQRDDLDGNGTPDELAVLVDPTQIVELGEDRYNTYVRLKPDRGRIRYRHQGSWWKEPGAARSAKEYEGMLRTILQQRPEVTVDEEVPATARKAK